MIIILRMMLIRVMLIIMVVVVDSLQKVYAGVQGWQVDGMRSRSGSNDMPNLRLLPVYEGGELVGLRHDGFESNTQRGSSCSSPGGFIYNWPGGQRDVSVGVQPCHWIGKDDLLVVRKCTLVNPLLGQARGEGLPVVLTPPPGYVEN